MSLHILIPKFTTKLARPYVTSTVSAGFPSPAEGYIEKQLDLNDHLIFNKQATFFVRVKGDSMIGAAIFDGDLLIVDKSLEARHNSIVIAVVDNEFTVKRLKINNNIASLVPENPKYKAIEFKGEEELAIWGVVSHVIRSCL